MKSELSIIYSDTIKRKYISYLWIHPDTKIRTVFLETYKLCRLVWTIPATSATSKQSFTLLKLPEKCSDPGKITFPALLNIEKALPVLDTLDQHLKTSLKHFIEKVKNRFHLQNVR